MNHPASDHPQFTLRQLLLSVTVIAVILAVAAPWLRTLMADWVSARALMTLIFIVLAFGLILVLGVSALRSRRTSTAAWAEGISHGIGMFGVSVLLIAVVPAFEKTFKEFDVPLPATTIHLVNASNAVARYGYLVMPLMAAFVVGDVLMFRRLHASPIRRAWAKAWSAAITALLLMAVLLSIAALFAPLTCVGYSLSNPRC